MSRLIACQGLYFILKMKRLLITLLALFILLGQQGSFEHAYHDHDVGEICDYCLSSKSLDHGTVDSIRPVIHAFVPEWQDEPALQVIHKNHISYFSVRAPPRFI